MVYTYRFYLTQQGEFREENFQKAMAVIREGGTDPGSLKGRKGGTKGTSKDFKVVVRVC